MSSTLQTVLDVIRIASLVEPEVAMFFKTLVGGTGPSVTDARQRIEAILPTDSASAAELKKLEGG
jgi:hypothetical protein